MPENEEGTVCQKSQMQKKYLMSAKAKTSATETEGRVGDVTRIHFITDIFKLRVHSDEGITIRDFC